MKTNLSKYASKPIALAGVVNHEFINASDAPGQFEAEQCDRQAVTARWLFEHPDFTGYLYLAGERDLGLDPWRVIQGADELTDGTKIILDVGRVRDVVVDPEFVVYVRRKDVEKEVAKAATTSEVSKLASKLLAEALIEAASAGSYSPIQAIHDELTQTHGVPGSDAAGEGMQVVLSALRAIAETGDHGPTREEMAEALRSIHTHFLAGYSAVLPAQKSVVEEVRTLVAKLGETG